MKVTYSCVRKMCQNGATERASGYDRWKSRRCSVFPLQLHRSGKLHMLNRIAQIRCLFTEDFLGVSIFRQKQSVMENEVKDLQVDIGDYRRSIVERVTANNSTSQSLELAGNYTEFKGHPKRGMTQFICSRFP